MLAQSQHLCSGNKGFLHPKARLSSTRGHGPLLEKGGHWDKPEEISRWSLKPGQESDHHLVSPDFTGEEALLLVAIPE